MTLPADSVGFNYICVQAMGAGGTSGAYDLCEDFLMLYDFDGFYRPVDNLPVVNVAKAGRPIPLKWSLRDGNGAPIVYSGSSGSRTSWFGRRSFPTRSAATASPGRRAGRWRSTPPARAACRTSATAVSRSTGRRRPAMRAAAGRPTPRSTASSRRRFLFRFTK